MQAWLTHVLRSFVYAWAGLVWALRTQRNLQVHAVGAVCATITGLLLGWPAWKWALLAIICGMVWTAELMNTAIEVLCDRVTREKDEAIRRVKDVAAGAVLAAAVAAVLAGLVLLLA